MDIQFSKKPVILFTLGDPVGIGPEIILRALNNPQLRSQIIPICIGNMRVISECMEKLNFRLDIKSIGFLEIEKLIISRYKSIFLIDPTDKEEFSLVRGMPDKLSAKCAVQGILMACKILKRYPNFSLVTAPISKRAIQQSKYCYYKGHTEILQEQFNIEESDIKNMIIVGPFSEHPLRMVNVTSHVPLREISKFLLSKNGRSKIRHTIELTCVGLKRLGFIKPRIAVTGINPHLEEWGDPKKLGQWGLEEQRAIIPTVNYLQNQGIHVFGPLTADFAYRQARMGKFDGIVGMFHDQSHIAAQSDPNSFTETVIFTIGTSFLRMSTSHGLAVEIANQFMADFRPIENCIRMILCLSKSFPK